MDDEVQRFFDSIKFSSDAFIGTTVKKVIFNRASKVYNVVLTCPNIIDKQSVDALFLACKNKIKGKSDCFVTLEYENMDEDILNVYLNELITSFYIDKPSLSKIHINYEDGIAKIVTHFSIESKIKVVSIRPGAIATKFWESSINNNKKAIWKRMRNFIVLIVAVLI